MADSGIEIKGLAELRRKLNSKKLLGPPMGRFFHRAANEVQGRARQNAPVDTGQLRQAIGTEVDSDPIPTWAKVGVLRAPFGTPMGDKAFSMEYGTGIFNEGRYGKKQRYFPPPATLDRWAKRHGFDSGRTVAYIIWKRGGLIPRRYLRDGLRDGKGPIQGHLQTLAKEIEANFK